MSKKKFIVIDGNSIANRAFYALPMLSNSQGIITNAAYGFLNTLLKIIEDEKPDYFAVAFDKGKIVFRHQQFENYKAQRKGMPEELRPQFPIIKDLLKAMKIAIFEQEGFEADDLIGTLVNWGEKNELDSIVVTGDKDSLQLITDKTKVMLVVTRKGIQETEIYDEVKVQEKYGLSPKQIIDLKGLMGDASDNIPGVPGVGEKTALKLLHEYGSVEQVLDNTGDFSGKKLGKTLEENKDSATMSKQLATIDCYVPMEQEVSLEKLQVTEPDYPLFLNLLKEFEFKTLLNKYLIKNQEGIKNKANIHLEDESRNINNITELKDYFSGSMETVYFSFITDINDLLRAKVTKMAFKKENAETVVVSTTEEVWQIIKPVLEDNSIKKIGYDLKMHVILAMRNGINIQGLDLDVLLAGYLLNPSASDNTIKVLAYDYLNIVFPEGTEEETLGAQLHVLENLVRMLLEKLEENKLKDLYYQIELPLMVVLAKMEIEGVKLDKDILLKIGSELDTRINEITKEIYNVSGDVFNINSPKQLGVVLFEKLGLPVIKKTKTGYSTNAEVLEALSSEHEIVQYILTYRQLAKLKSTYIDGLLGLINSETQKVHTSFNQAITATGRLSSTEPNLQNIPIRLEEGRRIRKAFIPSLTENVLLTADYSQIELRVLAHVANDAVLQEAFNKDQDIHTRTASEVFGVEMAQVDKDMRRAAKAVNFGIVYGLSDFGLAQDLGITRGQAKEYIDNYFKRYSGVKKYIDDIIQFARENGFVTTMLNRRRYLPDILSKNFNLRSFAERTAMNTPIQGSAADIIKLAMIKIDEVIKEKQLKTKMILQVHDELVFDVPKDELDVVIMLVRNAMEQAYPISVPLKVDMEAGENWYDLVDIK